MADSPFQLLQINQQVTSDAFGRIDRAMSESFQLAENSRQFDAKLEQRGTEFAAEMAFNDRQLQAQTAQNIHMAEYHKFGAELDLRKFEAERELDGERKEIAKINLEVAKANQQRALVQSKQQQMNQLTNPYDVKVAGMLASNKSADFGNEYLSIKSKYLGEVGSGKPFDENAFRSEVDTVIQKYQGAEGGSEYDPAVATLMDSMGATAEATRYRSQNPVFAGSVPGLKARMLLGDQDTFAKDIAVYGGMLKPEEQAQIAVVRNSLVGFNQTIQQQVRRLSDLTRQASSIQDDPKALEQNKQAQLEVSREISDLENRKNDLFNKTVGFNIDPVEEPTSTVKRAASNLLDAAKAETKIVNPLTGRETQVVSTLDRKGESRASENNIGSYTRQFPEEIFRDVSFKSLTDISISRNPALTKKLQSEIINNLEFMPLDESELGTFDNRDGSTQTLEKLIQSEAFKKIIGYTKEESGKKVKVEGDTANHAVYFNDGRLIVGTESITGALDNYLTQPLTAFQGVTINSHEELVSAIRNFEGTADQKRNYVQSLIGTVIAAGAARQWDRNK